VALAKEGQSSRKIKEATGHGDWEALADTCVKLLKNQTNNLGHNYEVCLFGDAKQDRTSIGKFSHWERVEKGTNASLLSKLSGNSSASAIVQAVNQLNSLDRMIYTEGQRCGPSKKHRTSSVSFQCGEQTSIISVSEPEVECRARNFGNLSLCK
jgi:hypothetical protein